MPAKKTILKEAPAVTSEVCCFECAFSSAKTDDFGETKVTLTAPATSLSEVLKLVGLASKHDQQTLYVAFQRVTHEA